MKLFSCIFTFSLSIATILALTDLKPVVSDSHAVNLEQPTINVLVLTVNTSIGKSRLARLHAHMHIPFTPIYGVAFTQFQSEAHMACHAPFALTEAQQQEWALRIPERKWEDQTATGQLACTMGHHWLWTLHSPNLRSFHEPRQWTLILEDDAKPTDNATHFWLTAFLHEKVPLNVELVFFDDVHCAEVGLPTGQILTSIDPLAFGSAAYAITTKGAQALLSVTPYFYNADYWLNAAINEKRVQAMCGPAFFLTRYPHPSIINS